MQVDIYIHAYIQQLIINFTKSMNVQKAGSNRAVGGLLLQVYVGVDPTYRSSRLDNYAVKTKSHNIHKKPLI